MGLFLKMRLLKYSNISNIFTSRKNSSINKNLFVFRAELSRTLMKARYLSSRKMMLSTYEEHIRLTAA